MGNRDYDTLGVVPLDNPGDGRELHVGDNGRAQYASTAMPSQGGVPSLSSPTPRYSHPTGMQKTAGGPSMTPQQPQAQAPKAMTPDDYQRMIKQMEAYTAAQGSMLDHGSSVHDAIDRDSTGAPLPEWLSKSQRDDVGGG